MPEKLVPVYRGLTTDDVQRLADYLDDRGIESYVDSTQSPMYGMSQSPSAHVLYVDGHIAEHAREIVRDFVRKWHGEVKGEEVEREQAGYEAPIGDRPSDDPLSSTNQDRERAYGPDIHEFDEEAIRRESPEVEDLIDETGHEDFDNRIVRFGPDHDVAEEDRDLLESEAVDEVDARQGLDEEETRPEDPLNQGKPRREPDEEEEP